MMKRTSNSISHIIYHIPGKKVGCTKNLKERMNHYRFKDGKEPKYEILEELHGFSNKEAGDREWEWADKLGYKREAHYNTVHEKASNAGKKTALLGLSGFKQQTFEYRSERSKRTATRMAAEKNTPAFVIVKCPHCNQEGNKMIMTRWHFDNCFVLKFRRYEKNNEVPLVSY